MNTPSKNRRKRAKFALRGVYFNNIYIGFNVYEKFSKLNPYQTYSAKLMGSFIDFFNSNNHPVQKNKVELKKGIITVTKKKKHRKDTSNESNDNSNQKLNDESIENMNEKNNKTFQDSVFSKYINNLNVSSDDDLAEYFAEDSFLL